MLNFINENKDKPFFLYYSSWLVHTPIQTRSKKLLEKYCKKLGIEYPLDPVGWPLAGQKNPYYCSMVEMLDHYIGQIITFLEKTPDPRRPGHSLFDNTYIIFTSDNGVWNEYQVKSLPIISLWIKGKLMQRRRC